MDKAVGAVPEVRQHHVELNNKRAVLVSDKPVEAVIANAALAVSS